MWTTIRDILAATPVETPWYKDYVASLIAGMPAYGVADAWGARNNLTWMTVYMNYAADDWERAEAKFEQTVQALERQDHENRVTAAITEKYNADARAVADQRASAIRQFTVIADVLERKEYAVTHTSILFIRRAERLEHGVYAKAHLRPPAVAKFISFPNPVMQDIDVDAVSWYLDQQCVNCAWTREHVLHPYRSSKDVIAHVVVDSRPSLSVTTGRATFGSEEAAHLVSQRLVMTERANQALDAWSARVDRSYASADNARWTKPPGPDPAEYRRALERLRDAEKYMSADVEELIESVVRYVVWDDVARLPVVKQISFAKWYIRFAQKLMSQTFESANKAAVILASPDVNALAARTLEDDIDRVQEKALRDVVNQVTGEIPDELNANRVGNWLWRFQLWQFVRRRR